MQYRDRFTLEILQAALARGRAVAEQGQVATYIPELAKADPRHFGIAVQFVGGETLAVGDTGIAFTMQSISKVLALACAQAQGAEPYRVMFAEPSGDAFHSIVKLEEERGRPRNPLINAGAIAVSSMLNGGTAAEKLDGLQRFLQRCSGGEQFGVDDAVYQSECRTGFRNRALANYMKHYQIIEDPDVAVETYFRQCALRVTAPQLARLSLFLAGDGCDPLTGERLLAPVDNQRLLAVMAICGLYDEVGRFAQTVGLPAKSGVSGGILAVLPGVMSIVTFGPALGPRGNSIAGMAALQYLSAELGLSLYTARDLA